MGNGKYKSIDEIEIPLLQQMRNLFSELGPPQDEHSWFVSYTYEPPLQKWKNIAPLIRKVLKQFKNSKLQDNAIFKISDNFEIQIFKASNILNNQFFSLGGYGQRDGCMLLAEMEKSLKFVIVEKTRKISKVRAKYPQWWLILVDHIGYSLDDFERDIFHDQVKVKHDWNKVILIDPRDGLRSFEIKSTN
jgi:hypothetical protein